ncbi:hypothetical protein ACFX19_032698 [Malus domestica]
MDSTKVEQLERVNSLPNIELTSTSWSMSLSSVLTSKDNKSATSSGERGASDGHISPDSSEMIESPSESISDSSFNHSNKGNDAIVPEILIEIVSEEEMALLEPTIVSAHASVSAIPAIWSSTLSFHNSVRSIQLITALSKKRLSGCSKPDIEDSSGLNSA